jgi:hypothetical protein
LEKLIDARLKRRSMIFVGILVACLAGYKLLTREPAPIPTAAQSCFEAGVGRPATAADSATSTQFFAALDTVFQALSSPSFATIGLEKFKAAQISPDFEPRLITWELMGFLSNASVSQALDSQTKQGYSEQVFPFGIRPDFQDLNAYVGSGEFGKALAREKLHPGVACEMKNLLQGRYLMVLRTTSLVAPGYVNGTKVYTTGMYRGRLIMLDLELGIPVSETELVAANDPAYDDPLHFNSAPIGIPLDNLLDNIVAAASQSAKASFGKPILPRPRR